MKRKYLMYLLAASMMLSPAITAGAVNITVDGNAKQYEAYRLLDLQVSLKKDDVHAEGEEHNADCYNYAYTVNPTYADILRGVADGADADADGTITDAELMDYISKLDATAIRTFADSVYAEIKEGAIAADSVSDGKIITTDAQGYYLIVESQNDDDPDSTSLVMLDTAGADNITVKSKEGIPSLEKKVKDSDSSDYTDATDSQRGDTVNFKLTGGMPSTIGNYKSYKYIFHDTMHEGLALVEDSILVTLGGEKVSAEDYTVTTADTTDGCTFEVAFADLKAVATKLGITLQADTECVLTYNATVTADVVVGNQGNPNEAHLEFSNDPYVTDSTSSTPDDTVKVFSFAVVINKVDKDNDPLTGAEFELYKKVPAQVEGEEDEWVLVETLSKNESGTVFTFDDLNQGEYRLVESVVPTGYNKADDVYFEIKAQYDTESDDPQITSYQIIQNGEVVSEGDNATFNISENLGTATGSVVNTTGIQLPHTGEFGRAILLYGGLGAMGVSAALVAIASKTRKKDEKK